MKQQLSQNSIPMITEKKLKAKKKIYWIKISFSQKDLRTKWSSSLGGELCQNYKISKWK